MVGLVDGGAGNCGSLRLSATIVSFVADGTVDARFVSRLSGIPCWFSEGKFGFRKSRLI